MEVPRPIDVDLSETLSNRNGQKVLGPDNFSKPMHETIHEGSLKADPNTMSVVDATTSKLDEKMEESNCTEASDFSVKDLASNKSNDQKTQKTLPCEMMGPTSTFQSLSSQYKMVWVRDDYKERLAKIRKIRRSKRLRTDSFIVDLDLSGCNMSTECHKKFVSSRADGIPAAPLDSSSEVRVGSEYQACVEKILLNKSLHDSRYSTSCADPFILWNPQKAIEAERSGEDIDGFLSKSDDLNLKILLMEALSIGQYNIRLATEIFVALYAKKSKLLYNGNADAFSKIFSTDHFAKTKDFDFVVSKLNCSKEIALINYYRWKRSNINRPEQYIRMKQEMHKESDVCEVCDNGGDLIVCDLCNKAYHCYCLTPPLTIIPHGEWFCPECETRSPAKLRRHMGYFRPSSASPQDKSSRASQMSEGHSSFSVAPPEKFESLKCIHKELFSGLEKPSIRPQTSLSSAHKSNNVKQSTYSPVNMTWDSARGFWIKNGTLCRNDSTDEMDVKNASNDTNIIRVHAMTSISNKNDGIDLRDNQAEDTQSKNVLVQPSHDRSTFNTSSASTMETPLLLRGQTYEVKIPVAPEGLLIYIEKRSGRFTSFSGYRQTSTGAIGFAQRTGAFMANGDFILEVDNVSCFKKSFAEVRSLLKTSRPGASMRILKMFHPLEISTNVKS